MGKVAEGRIGFWALSNREVVARNEDSAGAVVVDAISKLAAEVPKKQRKASAPEHQLGQACGKGKKSAPGPCLVHKDGLILEPALLRLGFVHAQRCRTTYAKAYSAALASLTSPPFRSPMRVSHVCLACGHFLDALCQ